MRSTDSEREEVIRLTGHIPSKKYNHKANQKNSDEIDLYCKTAKERNMTYGKLVAEQYKSQVKVVRRW